MLVCISIACNHPDNGHFRGRFDSLHYGNEQDMELQHTYWWHGVRVRYLGDGKVRISRRVFRFVREKEWFGNWCWNGLWMEVKEARRLLRYLRDSGDWHCEAGPQRLFHWFNSTSQRR